MNSNNNRIIYKKDVLKHNTRDDCWIILNNEVYNITNFLSKEHPGGYIPLSVVGIDATNIFIATHPVYVKEMINPYSLFHKKYHIGTLDVNEKTHRDDTIYYKLKIEVEKYMKLNKLKSRDLYIFDIEIIFFIISTIMLYTKILFSEYFYLYSTLAGISFTFLITRTIHDSNHGGLTRNNSLKRYIYTFIPEIISSNQSWQENHNLHHMHTNNIELDPDTDQIFRVSNKMTKKFHHNFQIVYTPILFFLFTLGQIVGYRYKPKNSYEPMHLYYHYFAKSILITLFWIFYTYNKLYYFIYSFLVSGFYLSIIFTVNHNQYFLSNEYINNKSFMHQQLSTTCDYNPGSKFINFISHGLNHQTFHHLFPSINYKNYPNLTKDVLIPFCKQNNLKYNGENITFPYLIYLHIISLYKWSKKYN